MGQKSSNAGGGGMGKAAAQRAVSEEDKFVNEMVSALVNNDPDAIPMSQSDLQSAVEAYAMTHPGTDEDALIDTINSAAYILEHGTTSTKTASVSGKPFDANDWTTWTVGTQVETPNDDIYSMNGRTANGPNRMRTGTVTEVHDNYIVVTDYTGTRNYVDKDIAPKYSVQKGATQQTTTQKSTPTSKASTPATTTAKPIPKSSVSVNDSRYKSYYGQPKGYGNWAFNIGGQDVFFTGKYTDAKKKAITEAAKRGIRNITVGT